MRPLADLSSSPTFLKLPAQRLFVCLFVCLVVCLFVCLVGWLVGWLVGRSVGRYVYVAGIGVVFIIVDDFRKVTQNSYS